MKSCGTLRDMKIALLIVGLVLVLTAPARAEMSGTATVVTGDVLVIAGEALALFGIDAPEPGQECVLYGNTHDCGAFATAALMDLTAGAKVVCRKTGKVRAGRPIAKCSAGGFDLSENMVHTGWALAAPRVGTVYLAKQREAQRAKRGLWRGTFTQPWRWRETRKRQGRNQK